MTVNGAKLVCQEGGETYDGVTAALGDEELTGSTVTVTKGGKEVGGKTLVFEDGQELTGDVGLYFK